MEDSAFLGTGWGFPLKFVKNQDGIHVRMASQDEDIKESLTILFSTQPGERQMQPEFGCNLHQVQFEEITESLRTKIKEMIRQAILFFEPRITLESIIINETEAIEGRLLIHLDYRIRSTNSRSNMVYPFYYLEGNIGA